MNPIRTFRQAFTPGEQATFRWGIVAGLTIGLMISMLARVL